MSEFKKLDDLPKVPHTYDDVMKAMAELFKLVTKQSHEYGGKNSRLVRAQVTEGSLLKSFENVPEVDLNEEVWDSMDLAHQKAEELSRLLEDSNDTKALNLLGQTLKYIGFALNKK